MAELHVKASASGGGTGTSGDPYTLQEAFTSVTIPDGGTANWTGSIVNIPDLDLSASSNDGRTGSRDLACLVTAHPDRDEEHLNAAHAADVLRPMIDSV